jgi:dolichyl-phosphate-mannose--protein O-mannosyl transferase
MPNILIKRPMFIYHFFGSTPFLALAFVSVIIRIYIAVKSPVVIISIMSVIAVLSLGLMIKFYPVLSGKECSAEKIAKLRRGKKWYF